MLEVVSEPLVAGHVVGGYRLERAIGQGGMGSVWAARREDGALFALKFARDDRPSDAKASARLLREARAASVVRHPNVVPVLAVLETEQGLPCLVMPYLEGEGLRAHLERHRVLTVAECARVFAGVVAGLAAVHAAGIVHRDLKPENVFVHRGVPMVLDFGIAKEVFRGEGGETVPPSLTSTGAMLGTPHYMAPEQIFGEKDVDARADVWAVGLMMYEALTGVLPTHGDGFGQVMKRITTTDFARVATLAPGVPPALDALVARMLSRARADRPRLDEAAAVLARFSDGASVPAPPHPGAPPVSPYASTARYVAEVAPRDTTVAGRRPWFAMLALAVAAGTGAVVTAAAMYVHSTRSPTSPVATAPQPKSTIPTPPSAPAPSTVVGPAPAPSAPLASTPSATAKKPVGPVPKPLPVPPDKPERHAVFESGTGRYTAMGSNGGELIRAVQTNLPSLRACFPAPTDETLWGVYIRIYWPRGGGRRADITAVKNGTGQPPGPENDAIVTCATKTFASFAIPDANGQDYSDAGVSYLFANAGYQWRSGPAP